MLRVVRRMLNVPIVAIVAAMGFIVGAIVAARHAKEKFLPVNYGHLDELLMLYMPVVVFSVAFNVQYHIFWQCFRQCVLLGGLGYGETPRAGIF
ncbi:hypothetical protein IscW_ISCW018797 [Ixodes scapularis]|uniref:Uncharacterized protein n=1 Tax=Ixodes scapularis TaxID=6945 RepID=B7PKY6_IXOSC|nr:hypothetical protein IscW_ISCW018797 [Ixodes scapularis]|eukprot:XP_002434434.1 hypothetical protein IscW_ISCW018797 [Ixodes scapularis]